MNVPAYHIAGPTLISPKGQPPNFDCFTNFLLFCYNQPYELYRPDHKN